MAAGFWAAGFTLETGFAADASSVTAGASAAAPLAVSVGSANPHPEIERLPAHLQPGRLVTMQPVDAEHDREHYITNAAFIGQPKRDGNRCVVFASETTVAYQSRSLSAMSSPGQAMDRTLTAVADRRGVFVLDTEKTYLDCRGGEHRTGSQTATANAELGNAAAPVVCVMAVFKALYADGTDFTTRSDLDRITAAKAVVEELQRELACNGDPLLRIELVPTAMTTEQKRELCRRQLAEGREGEVWIRRDTSYRGGKQADEMMVRTKYLTETEVVITGLTPTTVRGRPFAALEVSERQTDGTLRPVGSVGTGFSQKDARDLAAQHLATPGMVRIMVLHQGRTENGLLWHARYLDLA